MGVLHVSAAERARHACLGQRWDATLRTLTELASDLPTHFTTATSALSRIDRCFVSAPSWLLCMLDKSVSTARDPADLAVLGISDHTPVLIALSARARPPATTRALPPKLFATKGFQRELDALVASAELDSLPHAQRNVFHAEILREAALLAQHEEDESPGPSRKDTLMHLHHIARMVASDDQWRLRRLLQSSTLAQELLCKVDGCVALASPPDFEARYAAARLQDTFPFPVWSL